MRRAHIPRFAAVQARSTDKTADIHAPFWLRISSLSYPRHLVSRSLNMRQFMARGARGARPERPSKFCRAKNMPGLCRACSESRLGAALAVSFLLLDESL